MKQSIPLIWKISLTMAFGLVLLMACGDQQSSTGDKSSKKSTGYDKVTDFVAGTSSTAPCECDSSWFPHSQTPPPAEGQGSPFDTTSTTVCLFHQWSWQKFLYMTKPQQNGLPLFMNELKYVDANMNVIGTSLKLSSTGQAGGGGILKTDPAFNPSVGTAETVYYSIHINDVMYNSATSFAAQLKSGAIPPSNTYTFPVNSLEMKAAWVSTDAIPSAEQNQYFTTTASVLTNGSYVNKTMALLGLHVVGRVINHPEFIWATFEHNQMGPLFDWVNNSATAASDELLFGQGNTNTLAGIQWNKGTQAPNQANQAYTLFANGVMQSPGGSYTPTSQSEPTNIDNINYINSCVASNLNDVWNNYFYKGSIWLNMDGLSPTAQADSINNLGRDIYLVNPGTMVRGCVSLANISMETFEQTFATDMAGISNLVNNSNCFACHNSESFSNSSDHSPLYLSHIFDGYMTQTVHKKTAVQIQALKKEQYEALRASIKSLR